MCTVISGANCNCSTSSSSGVTAEGFLGASAILGGVALAGWVFEKMWVLLAVGLVLGWLLYWRTTRRAAFLACALILAGVLWLARKALKRRRKPVSSVALPRPYKATVYVTGPDGRRAVLGTAPVPGVWVSAEDVQREVVQRWLATHGRHPAGELGCHARPVGGPW